VGCQYQLSLFFSGVGGRLFGALCSALAAKVSDPYVACQNHSGTRRPLPCCTQLPQCHHLLRATRHSKYNGPQSEL
jgi:hypothetical protein